MAWSYTGYRRVASGWETCSGCIDSDGSDDPDDARNAAEALGAEKVILRDERRHIVSVRDQRGAWVVTDDEEQAREAAARPETD